MPPIKYILLDCDNTLCLSEKLAFEACSDLTNELLEKHGIQAHYSVHDLLENFVGQNFRGMMVSLTKKYNFTLSDEEFDTYVDRELGKVVETLEKKAQPCPGAIEMVEKLDKEGKYKLAVVSSSALSRVEASLRKVGLDRFIPHDAVFSAATSLPKPTSKPDPAIYVHSMKVLGVKAEECVAVEDSKSGASAAKNAKIPLIGYVGPYPDDEKEHMIKVLRDECGAIYIMNHWDEFPEALKKVEESLS